MLAIIAGFVSLFAFLPFGIVIILLGKYIKNNDSKKTQQIAAIFIILLFIGSIYSVIQVFQSIMKDYL